MGLRVLELNHFVLKLAYKIFLYTRKRYTRIKKEELGATVLINFFQYFFEIFVSEIMGFVTIETLELIMLFLLHALNDISTYVNVEYPKAIRR